MVLHCDFFSPVLRRDTHVNVILPTPSEKGQKMPKDLKVLYLLHGLNGDECSWLHYSNIRRYANAAGIAVVIPGVGNSWYQNMAHGEDFFTYITEELYEYVQALFPVSKKREDTFIAGLSMGGYGAWYLGLACPEKFSATASFSGAVDIAFRYLPEAIPEGAELPFYVDNCFGDPTKIAGSDRDVYTLFEKAKAKGIVPRMYQSCGTADFLYQMNVAANKKLTEMGAEITWRETPGVDHVWDFWDSEVRWILENWLLEEK